MNPKGRPRKAPGGLSGWFCIHASSDDVQHIASIAQWHAAEQCEVAQDHGVGGQVATHREVFKELSDGSNSVTGGAEQGVQGLGGVDEEGREVVGVAG